MKLLDEFKRNFYKDGTKEWHPGKIVSSIVALIALLIFSLYKNTDLKNKALDRERHRKYTIGTTGSMHSNFRSSKPTVVYYYQVLKSTYRELEHIDDIYEKNVVSNGGRYYVEFSSINPNNSKLLLGYKVPDSILSCPDSGWSQIPGVGFPYSP
jgi:hypothetical protein